MLYAPQLFNDRLAVIIDIAQLQVIAGRVSFQNSIAGLQAISHGIAHTSQIEDPHLPDSAIQWHMRMPDDHQISFIPNCI